MANAGAKPAKPVWFGSKKFKSIIFFAMLGVVLAAVFFFVLKPNSFQSTPRNLLSETIAALSANRIHPKATPPSNTTVLHLRAVGDIMMSRSVGLSATKRQNWNWPFEGTTPYLPPVDLTVGNLEFPLTDPCQLREKVMTFCAPTKAVEGLVYGNINLVSMANNHILNFGQRGFADTKATLTKAGIIGVADYETTTMDLEGIKVSFLALDDITHPLNLDSVYPIMADLGARSQAIIVLIHWGNEYQPLPNERQKTIAKALVNSGATIILGTHPHVLQPIEVEGNSLIVYSLGNFVFDQMWSEATRKSIILELDLTFTEGKLTHLNHESIPITIFEYGQPRLDANL